MKKLLLFLILLLFFASCNQSKIDSLNNHIQLLQKDSIAYTVKINSQSMKIDSLQIKAHIADSVVFVEKLTSFGDHILNVYEKSKLCAYNHISYSEVSNIVDITFKEYQILKPHFKKELCSEIEDYLQDIDKTINRFGNDTYDFNQSLRKNLFFAATKYKVKHLIEEILNKKNWKEN